MPDTYTLEVVTPERMMLSEPVIMTIAPGTEGDLGVLVGHIPLMTALRPGEVRVTLADGRTTSHIVIGGGFLEVAPSRTTILADSAERVDEIDLSRAEIDLTEAQRMLGEVTPGTAEAEQAQRAADHAEARVRAARRS